MYFYDEQDWDEIIMAKYPEVYSRPQGDGSEPSLCFGFECDSGWSGILEGLSVTITNAVRVYKNQNPDVLFQLPFATQVKEKFGELRFYMSGYMFGEIEGAIEMAMAMSVRTCEICGCPGKKRNPLGWMKTMCKTCYGKWERPGKNA